MAALLSSAEIKAHLGITGSGYDARITALLTTLEPAMLVYCRRELTGWLPASYSEVLWLRPGDKILLRWWPVISIESLTITDTSNTVWTYAVGNDLDGSDDLMLHPTIPGRVQHNPAGLERLVCGKLTATYTAGYAADGPDGLALKGIGLSIADWQLSRSGAVGVLAAGGGHALRYADPAPWPPEITAALDRYMAVR